MKFLVILVCLLINHYWYEDRALNGDAWFIRFRGWLSSRLEGWELYTRHPVIKPALLLMLPLLVLYVLLWLVDEVLLGFITLGLHVLVLMLAFDRLNMPDLVQQYLASWRAGNYEGAFTMLQQRLQGRLAGQSESNEILHRRFCDLLLASYFERLFAVVFWYLLLGPAGVLVYALLRMYLVNDAEELSSLPSAGDVGPEADTVPGLLQRLLFILEWLPARLLALTFSLAGDFVAAFTQLRARFTSVERGLAIVRASAFAALGNSRVQPVTVAGEMEIPVAEDMDYCPDWAARQVEELMALLMRSQIIWVTLIALLTLYGVD